jgi:hypothetical protein
MNRWLFMNQPAEKSLPSQAQEFLAKAGTAKAAKQAIDEASQRAENTAPSKDDVAKSYGFASYLEMFEASTAVAAANQRQWHITPLHSGRWLAWNETDLPRVHEAASKEAALEVIEHASAASPPALPPAPPTG